MIDEATIEAEAWSNEATVEAEAWPNEATVEARADKPAIEAPLEASTPESATTAPATLG